jgi:hypothetical protein
LSPGPQVAADPATLRDCWRLRSLARGWVAADDWHSAAVDVVTQAISGRAAAADLTGACVGLGRSRACAGVGIAETIEDLAALFAVLDRGAPPLPLVSSLAEGWAEEGLARHAQGCCEDPLTGLATVAYLRTRLAEVYREAACLGTAPSRTHRLIVLRVPPGRDRWRQLARAITLGHDLRTAFPGGDTLAQAGAADPAIGLVRAYPDLRIRYSMLHRVIGGEISSAPLPATLAEALRLVAGLAH